MKKESSKEKKDNYILYFFTICLLIVLTTIAYFFIFNTKSFEKRGTFGDMFGALTAVFSGFAFAGVIITILMQMKELELTRRELKKSADAQEKSQEALNEQLKTMNISSKIDSLNQYLSNVDSNSDKAFLAKNIISSITEEYFFLKEHDELTKPILRYTDYNLNNSKSHKGVKIWQIRFTNIGAAISDIEIIKEIDRVKLRKKANSNNYANGYTFNIEIESPIDEKFDVTIPIKLIGSTVKNEWIQYLCSKNIEDKIAADCSEPEFRKRYDE